MEKRLASAKVVLEARLDIRKTRVPLNDGICGVGL